MDKFHLVETELKERAMYILSWDLPQVECFGCRKKLKYFELGRQNSYCIGLRTRLESVNSFLTGIFLPVQCVMCQFSNVGLEYLHDDCNPPIIHRDVKPSNILVNEKFQAKLADLGLSRVIPADDVSYVSTAVAGTPGYLDPE